MPKKKAIEKKTGDKKTGEKKKPASAPVSGTTFGVLAVEIAVYSALVTAYLLLVLRSITPLLLSLEQHHRVLYGFAAVLLMLGQGLLLEFLTTLLVGRFRRARRDDAIGA